MIDRWHNWSGSVAARPASIAAPRSEDELAALVRRAGKLRVVGAGHSFTPLCATDGTLIQLADLDSPVELAADGASAWVPAGWSLRRIAAALWQLGCSLPNQGDVDPQSLAGAIATGTHGTGAELGSLSTFARAFRLVLPDGSVVECSRDARPELYEAQRLSLGLVGIATRIRIDVVPAYRLEQRIARVGLDEVCERFAGIAATHRHAEFFAFPYADDVIVKTLHPTADDSAFRPPRGDAEARFQRLCDLCRALPFATGWMQRRLMAGVRGSRRVGPAHQIFPSERRVRFEEMEYEVPRAAAVIFPFEFRWTAGDDIWLSPFHAGPCASISLHQYARKRWQALFRDAEPIFRAHGGRPHWGKRHTLAARDVFALYPRARDFCAVRRRIDPDRKLANDYLIRLFEL
ncbi:MAG: FAD-binding protein [Deltaproteobacteria bacterium]|nr:MAG: FAD-binding protein [Deltaproteobacteria bacterium]